MQRSDGSSEATTPARPHAGACARSGSEPATGLRAARHEPQPGIHVDQRLREMETARQAGGRERRRSREKSSSGVDSSSGHRKTTPFSSARIALRRSRPADDGTVRDLEDRAATSMPSSVEVGAGVAPGRRRVPRASSCRATAGADAACVGEDEPASRIVVRALRSAAATAASRPRRPSPHAWLRRARAAATSRVVRRSSSARTSATTAPASSSSVTSARKTCASPAAGSSAHVTPGDRDAGAQHAVVGQADRHADVVAGSRCGLAPTAARRRPAGSRRRAVPDESAARTHRRPRCPRAPRDRGRRCSPRAIDVMPRNVGP